jgi:hypothetical protein
MASMRVDSHSESSYVGVYIVDKDFKTVQAEYKSYYSTNDVAKITGVKPSAIREAKRKGQITPSGDFDIAALMFDANEVIRYAETRNIRIEFTNK